MPDAMEAKKKATTWSSRSQGGRGRRHRGGGAGEGREEPRSGTKFIDWTFSKDMQDLLDKNQVYMLPALPAHHRARRTELMKEARLLPSTSTGRKTQAPRRALVNEVIKE